jgi:hypothetical protein
MNISMTTAQLDDPQAMVEFLSTIPNADRLAKLLEDSSGVSSRAYEDETWTARFVASDGHRVKCFAVSGITIDQAEMIAVLAADLLASNEAEFRDLVDQALGPTL